MVKSVGLEKFLLNFLAGKRSCLDFHLESKMLRFNVRGVRSIDGATRALVPVTSLAAGGLTFTFLLE